MPQSNKNYTKLKVLLLRGKVKCCHLLDTTQSRKSDLQAKPPLRSVGRLNFSFNDLLSAAQVCVRDASYEAEVSLTCGTVGK